MRVMIRTDSSSIIGSGHVMRCLCLARALRTQGNTVAFWCRSLAGDMRAFIVKQGFDVHTIAFEYDTAGMAQQDAFYCRAHAGAGIDLVVVDHYGLDHRWERSIRAAADCVMALDDLATRDHDCDILLDTNVLPGMAVSYDGLVPQSCRQLLGPDYALLGDAFQNICEPMRTRKQVCRLLLFFGGGDSKNVTSRVLQEVADLGLCMDVVIGASNPYRDSVAVFCETIGSERCRLHVQTAKMAELMHSADLMLSAGGSTHWERCRMGLPAIVASVASNQVVVSAALAEQGTCVYLGNIETVEKGAWYDALQSLIQNEDRVKAMQLAARGVVPDGQGCTRVLQAVEEVMAACK